MPRRLQSSLEAAQIYHMVISLCFLGILLLAQRPGKWCGAETLNSNYLLYNCVLF